MRPETVYVALFPLWAICVAASSVLLFRKVKRKGWMFFNLAMVYVAGQIFWIVALVGLLK
jgi:hypothetical protein